MSRNKKAASEGRDHLGMYRWKIYGGYDDEYEG